MNRRTLLPFQGWRLVFFRSVAVCMFMVLILRTWQLQFVQGAELKADANENRFQTLPIQAPRGAMYDRHGNPLALNDPAFIVNIVPADLPDTLEETLEVYNRLSALIDVPATRAVADAVGRTDERSIDELVREGQGVAPFRPVPISADVDKDVAMQILEEKQELPGVQVEYRSVRNYPSGLATAQVIGYLGPIPENRAQELRELGYNPAFDRIGYSGLESYLEDDLAGKSGSVTYEVDVAGEPLRLIERVQPNPGYSVQLTIDLPLQQAAQQALVNRINAVNADAQRLKTQSGVVIAMNPKTGEILALVSWPTYDNSRFARAIDADYYFDLADSPLRPFVNHAVQSLYPPGSVWKILTSAAVVEEEVIDPFTLLTDNGSIVLQNAYAVNDVGANQTFVCWLRTGHGSVNLLQGIAQSCDVYFYQVGGGSPDARSAVRPGGLGIDDLYRWATAFGVGSTTGVELPLENAGRMPDRQWKRRTYGESWSTGDTYNAAFGQGYLTVTPLQLISAVASVANGGNLMQPTLISNFQDANGNILREFPPQVMRTLVQPTDGGPLVLLLQEDMLIQGADSLACRCEPQSGHTDLPRCNPESYVEQFDNNPDPNVSEWVDYTVHIPYGFSFDFSFICDPLSFNLLREAYIPPTTESYTFDLINQGMRLVVTEGTAMESTNPAFPPLQNVNEAGKTGTAEYCDDVAFPQGLCIPGRWPSHAWYVGYAPYEDPEIIVIAFVYNAGEGSAWALPVVRQTMEFYFACKENPAAQNCVTGTLPTAPTVILPEETTPTEETSPEATPEVTE